MISIIIAILVFGLIIAIHEFGHFIVAKMSGVKVNQFALGMGPAIFKFKKGETLYALRLFPIGGFCSMEGEDESSDDSRAFGKKPVWKRICIVAAGAFMNLVLGFILIIIIVGREGSISTTQISGFKTNEIEKLCYGTVAVVQYDNKENISFASSDLSGLNFMDEIVEINGMHIFTTMDITYQFQSDEDKIFDMKVKRDGKIIELEDVKFKSDANNSLVIDFTVLPKDLTVGSVLGQSGKQFGTYSRLIWISFADLVQGKYKINDLSGPVGIIDTIGQVVDSEKDENDKIDWSGLLDNVLFIAAFISINVGIFNLLPFPALDGARIVFLIIEAIRKKPIKPEKEGMIHFIGIAILLLLMAIVTFSDISKILHR